ncbi:MAG: S-layer homology domain-containing protein [Pseudoflavonifractor capillosus]|uniref:S-layer homology domain-containing protein n=1 Tax=Pseudoflavonifractor capillosus TaxID=106588 RepID=UPI0023F9367B|nr:S-layer homology domain-containing protein [Pseudoflavonifractor capillosus]MCI5929678.1 S-layer homology domain-containing protein [Pseudoflavonifractor capillosus]
MKRKIASLLLAGAMTVNIAAVSTAAHAAAFTDVPDDAWYSQAVDYAVSHGMFSGTGAGTFSPSTPMTRGMIVVVLSNVAKADVSSSKDANFSDVQPSDWYADAINWAYKQGYVSGTGANTFSPNSVVTRAQIAVILSNYLHSINADLEDDGNSAAFNDIAAIPSWALEGVKYMQAIGLMAGDSAGNFNPNKELTRAEAATVFMRMDQKLNGDTSSDSSSSGQSGSEITLPGGIVVKDDPISVKEAFKTIAPGVNDTQVRPGKSSKGLIPAGTEMAVGDDVVEQQVYVDLGNGIIGVMTTTFNPKMTVRSTTLEINLFPGDTFSLNSEDCGFVKIGKWKSFQSDIAAVTTIDDHRANITAKKSGGAAVVYDNSTDVDSEMIFSVQVRVFERRPAEGETANFRLDTDNEPVYYVSPSPEYYRLAQVWYTDKGTKFTSKDSAHYTSNGLDVIGNIYVYPDADANIAKSDITAQGYVKPECITKYYSISTSETDTRYLAVGDYLTLGFYVMNSAAENTVVTVYITSLETGLTETMDIAIRYAG